MTQVANNPAMRRAATVRDGRWVVVRGLALLEVLLALGVFIVAAVFVLDSLSGALRGVRTAQLEADAADIAVTITSQMQIGQLERVNAGPVAVEMPGYEQWTWQAAFEGLEDRLDLPQLKKLTLTVRSEADGFEHSVTQFVWDNPNPPQPPLDASQLAQSSGGDLSSLQGALGGAAAGGELPAGGAAPGNSANGGGFPGSGSGGAGAGNAGAGGTGGGAGRGVSRPSNGPRQAPGGFNTGNVPRSGDGFRPGSNVPRSGDGFQPGSNVPRNGDGFRPPQNPVGGNTGNVPRGSLPRGADGFRPGQNAPRSGDGFQPGKDAPRNGDGFRPPQNPSGGNAPRSGDGFRPGQDAPRNGDGFRPSNGAGGNGGGNSGGNRPTPPANRPAPPPPSDGLENVKDKSDGGGR